jgi:hypothetical protein
MKWSLVVADLKSNFLVHLLAISGFALSLGRAFSTSDGVAGILNGLGRAWPILLGVMLFAYFLRYQWMYYNRED